MPTTDQLSPRTPWHGRGRVSVRQYKKRLRHPRGRHDHESIRTHRLASPRFRGDQTDGVFRTVPRYCRGLYRIARGAGKADAQRCISSFHARDLQRTRFGFRCGFLGMLHMEIITERLSREYDQTIINTVPNVEYHTFLNNGQMVEVDSRHKCPTRSISTMSRNRMSTPR